MSGSMWGIGYVVVEMRTRKLLKRLMATPMSRAQFLWSFVLMRAAFFFLELPLLLLFGWLAFGVGVAGSLVLLVALSLLGAVAFAGLGLLVAARAQNTQTVSGLINLVMGLMIWSEWPSSALWVIGLFVGVDLLVHGWWLVMLAMSVKSLPTGAPV